MLSLSNHRGCITAGLVFRGSNMHDTMQLQYWKSQQSMYFFKMNFNICHLHSKSPAWPLLIRVSN